MILLRKLYTLYGFIIFTIFFFVAFLFFLVPIFFPARFRWIGIINRWWARFVLTFILLPYKVEYRQTLDPEQQYVFCPNHFSYFDIPALGLNHYNAIFVGKNDIENIPLFG